jgi:ATP-dependent protease ClpP protease subunit
MKMRNNDNDQIIELIQQDNFPSMIKSHRTAVSVHTIFFDEDIGAPAKYRELNHLLYNAEEYDQFVFVMGSSGGDLDGALSIIEAVKASSASVRAIITGKCHSAASIITLNCAEVMVTKSAHMLVHTASYSAFGSTGQIKSNVDFSTKQIKQILETTYGGFLTPAEIVDVHKGVEFWFDDKEIAKRLQNKQKYQEENAAAHHKAPKTKKPPVVTPVAPEVADVAEIVADVVLKKRTKKPTA